MKSRSNLGKKYKSAQENWDIVYDLVAPDLLNIGVIRNYDLHLKHQNRLDISRAYFTKILREIMTCMIEQGKARKLKQGQYQILKPIKI